MNFVRAPGDFFIEASKWIHDGYSISIRYLILGTVDGPMRLSSLSIVVGPMPIDEEMGFAVSTPLILAGQIHLNNQSAARIISVLNDAAMASFFLNDVKYSFKTGNYIYSTELDDSERWEYDLHLRAELNGPDQGDFDFSAIDRSLRTAEIPFDGLHDLTLWMGLRNPNIEGYISSVELRVRPPVDCIVNETRLIDDRLTIKFACHPSVETSAISVGIRVVPGGRLSGRKQVANEISWSSYNAVLNTGTAVIPVQNADAVLVLVSFFGKTVRRHWFADPVKARNSRAFATRLYDPELRQLRRGLLEATDSTRFELSICSLLFMLGFAAAPQLETDAPDLIATTPGGRMILIECTLRTADFQTKVGKLVDRRNSLKSEFAKAQHFVNLHAVLICRTPKEQIVYDESNLKQLDVVLFAYEDLEQILNRALTANDPDEYFSQLEKARKESVG